MRVHSWLCVCVYLGRMSYSMMVGDGRRKSNNGDDICLNVEVFVEYCCCSLDLKGSGVFFLFVDIFINAAKRLNLILRFHVGGFSMNVLQRKFFKLFLLR